MCISSQACLALAMTAVCRAWDSSTWHGMYSKTCREPSHPSLQSCVIILGPRVARRDSNWALFHSQKSELPNKLILVYHNYNQLYALFRVKVNVASVPTFPAVKQKCLRKSQALHLSIWRRLAADSQRVTCQRGLALLSTFLLPIVSPFPSVPMWHEHLGLILCRKLSD